MKITTWNRITEIELDWLTPSATVAEIVKTLHQAGHDRVHIDFAPESKQADEVSEIHASAGKPKRLLGTLLAAEAVLESGIGVQASSNQSPTLTASDMNSLSLLAYAAYAPIASAAEAGQLDLAPITGEQLLQLVQQRGGNATLEFDPETGVIESVQASFVQQETYEYAEVVEVLESLHATGTARPIVGDFAQTSILTSNGQEQVIGLAEWSISWKRKTVESTNTDNALYESSLGSTKMWTAKAKYMYLVGDATQSDAVLSAVDTSALAPVTWNFFPDIGTGEPAFQGQAIIDGIDIGAGSGKIVGLDVSLKGTGPLLRKVQTAPVANPNTVTGQTAQV